LSIGNATANRVLVIAIPVSREF